MLRRYIPVLFFLLFLVTHTAAAIETVHVLVLPFKIHASESLSYLKKDIPKVILEHLQTEGAVSVEMDKAQPAAVTGITSDVETL